MGWSGGTYTRSDGVFTGTSIWQSNRDAGTKIVADRHDTHDQDLATGINQCLNKDGSNAATADLDAGTYRITRVGDGTAHTDAINAGQIQDGGLIFQATDSGSADAYAIALTPAVTAYVAGQVFHFKAANTSTGASTLNVNALGTKNIKKKNDQDIAAGDIEQNAIVSVIYDGTSFQMLSQLGTSAGSMSSFTLTGDSGSNQTVEDGNTVDIAGGTGIDTVVGATDTVTVAIDATVPQLATTNAFTGVNRNALTTDNDGSFDMNANNNFKCTPSGNFTLTFTNFADGQSGYILLVNSGGHTVSLHANSKADANLATTVSTAGTSSTIPGAIFHKSACVFASQQDVRVQSEYSIDALGTKVVADLLYGVKLIDDSDNKKGVKFTNVD